MTPERDISDISIVCNAITSAFNVTHEELMSRSRTDRIAFARQVAMAALVEQFGYSQTKAALAFRRWHHQTAGHAQERVKARVTIDLYARHRVGNFLRDLSQLRQAT